MTSEARQLLQLIASRKQGRVSFALVERDRADALAQEALDAGYLKRRRLGYDEGYQITTQGRLFLAGAAE
jgi:hypothetical protein